MRITFVLPSLVPTGGAQVVLRHAAYALAAGHTVRVLAGRPSLRTAWRARDLVELKRWVAWHTWQRVGEWPVRLGIAPCVRAVRRVDARSASAADVIVATSYVTAEWVAALPASAGRRVYFLQGYEAYDPEDAPRVDATWRLPFVRLAVSRWLMEWGAERLGVACHGPIGNGVDSDWFHPAERAPARAVAVVGAVYESTPGKGMEVLSPALLDVARARPGTRFLLFGRSRLQHALPAGTRYVWNPRWRQIAALYRDMDVFVHASVREGWGMPPMEAMASGCAVVAAGSGGVPEFTDAASARVVPPGDPGAIARATVALLDDPPARRAMGAAARARMRAFGWPAASQHFLAELERAAACGDAA
jgi:glycosyltransferase involved in cell wall biosynthesis